MDVLHYNVLVILVLLSQAAKMVLTCACSVQFLKLHQLSYLGISHLLEVQAVE